MYLKWLMKDGERVEESVAAEAFQGRTDHEAVLSERGWKYVEFFLPLKDAVELLQATSHHK